MFRIENPYENLEGGAWLRGNLHTHTTRSDGSWDPQATIDDYANRGYGFLMFSDHDLLTTEQDYQQWNNRNMALISGAEISANGPHLLYVDAHLPVASSVRKQQVLNEIAAAAKETGHGFAVLCHPNWEEKFDHCTLAQLREWVEYAGMEIYNGVIGKLDGSSYALDKWDLLLSGGRRVWGFANDDRHHPDEAEFGWNTAYAKERSVAGVVDALKNGRFYCSTGVVISDVRVEDATIRIETENAQRIVAIQNIGKRFASVDDRTIQVDVPPDAKYVRFECWGPGERFAWTQPFYVTSTNTDARKGGLVREWHVSRRLDGISLDDTNLEEAAGLAVIPAVGEPDEHAAPGFVDVREQIQAEPGIVYLVAEISSETDCRGVVYLGFDGPVRAWVNDEQVFAGPGTNPAIADAVCAYGHFKRGKNRLTIALDSHNGKAWGIFARVRLSA